MQMLMKTDNAIITVE